MPETGRIFLRNFEESDFAAVHCYAGSAENTIFMPWGPNSEGQTADFIAEARRQGAETPCRNYQLAVICKETGGLIGGCCLSLAGGKGEVGWILHRDFWNRGIGTEVCSALLAFGFETLGLWRITARSDAENIASFRVMEKNNMRREGLFLDARPSRKGAARPYGDELFYAITQDEWEIAREIAYFNGLPVAFCGFIDLPFLTNGEIHLVCKGKVPGDAARNWLPYYDFHICRGSETIGQIDLRIGYGGGPFHSNLYYGGHIGYTIWEAHRGKGFAAAACRLLLPVARAHKMETLLISNVETNRPSARVCEKLGAKLLRLARLPEWHELYQEGQRYVNIFQWDV